MWGQMVGAVGAAVLSTVPPGERGAGRSPGSRSPFPDPEAAQGPSGEGTASPRPPLQGPHGSTCLKESTYRPTPPSSRKVCTNSPLEALSYLLLTPQLGGGPLSRLGSPHRLETCVHSGALVWYLTSVTSASQLDWSQDKPHFTYFI